MGITLQHYKNVTKDNYKILIAKHVGKFSFLFKGSFSKKKIFKIFYIKMFK